MMYARLRNMFFADSSSKGSSFGGGSLNDSVSDSSLVIGDISLLNQAGSGPELTLSFSESNTDSQSNRSGSEGGSGGFGGGFDPGPSPVSSLNGLIEN